MKSSKPNEHSLRKGNSFNFGVGDCKGEIRFVPSADNFGRFELTFNGELLKSTKTLRPVERKMILLLEEHRTHRPIEIPINYSPEDIKTIQLGHQKIVMELERLLQTKEMEEEMLSV